MHETKPSCAGTIMRILALIGVGLFVSWLGFPQFGIILIAAPFVVAIVTLYIVTFSRL